jgi:hypothetical protein
MAAKTNFTPDEANTALPLLRRIVADILRTSADIRDLPQTVKDEQQRDKTLDRLMRELQEYFAEVEELGCTYRDWSFSLGLVDFPAQIDGEDVYLCWRSDERDVRYFHGLMEGYAGRRLIPQAHAEEVLG